MPTHSKKISFFDSQQAVEIKQLLEAMTQDPAYNTAPSYSANSVLYPNNLIPFVDKQMNYIRSHPTLDPWQYVSNLRLMTRIR